MSCLRLPCVVTSLGHQVGIVVAPCHTTSQTVYISCLFVYNVRTFECSEHCIASQSVVTLTVVMFLLCSMHV